jgi:hypothetical protein
VRSPSDAMATVDDGGDDGEDDGDNDERLLDHARWVTKRHDHHALTAAGHALSHYDARSWISELGVPAACVITTKDRLVPKVAQYELATLLGAAVFEVPHGHVVCTRVDFGAVVVEAAESVRGALVIKKPRGGNATK